MTSRKLKRTRLYIAIPMALCICGLAHADPVINQAEQQVNGTRSAYDAQGSVVANPDTPSPGSTRYTYDADTHSTEPPAAPNPNSTTYDYDAQDRVTVTPDPGHATTYSYDDLDRVTQTIDSPSPTMTEYDSADQTSQSDTATPDNDTYGGRTTYDYDAAGNDTIKQTDPLGNTTTYDYDALNRTVESIDGTDSLGNTTHYDYDALNRMIQDTDSIDIGVQGGTNYGYDTIDEGIFDFNGNGTPYLYDAQGSLDFSGDAANVDFSVTLFDTTTNTSILKYVYDGPTTATPLSYNLTSPGLLSSTDNYEYSYSLELSGTGNSGVTANTSFQLVPLPASVCMGGALLAIMAGLACMRVKNAAL